jgi:hypothetical protein
MTTCGLEELSNLRLALLLQFIGQPSKVSGKDFLDPCGVLQDVPVILVDVFHGALIARSERCSAMELLDRGHFPPAEGRFVGMSVC